MSSKALSALVAFQILASAACAAPTRTILLQVAQPQVAWSDSRILNKLQTQFARDAHVYTAIIDAAEKPGNPIGCDSTEVSAKYSKANFLLSLTISSERLDRRKGFTLPLFFHKWETVGIIEGEMRLVDLQRGKLMIAEPFVHELQGPGVFQGSMDDTKNDPDIHIDAPQKAVFFTRLEEGLVTRIVARTKTLIGTPRSQDRELFTQKISK